MYTSLTPAQLAAYFDHTQLRAYACKADFETLCQEARDYGFAMVAINPAPVRLCKELLAGTPVHVGAAVGFPLGQNTLETKLFETGDAIANGADEIDMVINIGMVKERNYGGVLEEIRAVRRVCAGKILKVIIETCLLTEEEKTEMCRVVTESGADYIKTSTGFASGGATFEDVELMRRCVGPQVKVKAAGGISSVADAEKFIELGADRLGTSRLIKLLKA